MIFEMIIFFLTPPLLTEWILSNTLQGGNMFGSIDLSVCPFVCLGLWCCQSRCLLQSKITLFVSNQEVFAISLAQQPVTFNDDLQ